MVNVLLVPLSTNGIAKITTIFKQVFLNGGASTLKERENRSFYLPLINK